MGQSRHKTRRKKQEQTKRRFEAIKDLMSTFAMSTVAVVAAVTLIPASPKADITKAVSLSEEIVYQVQVTDEDNALDIDTLYVVLENQLEYYSQPLALGEQSGLFDNLKTNTQYRLSVYGNKGFGQERLDTMLLTTRAKVGGTILSVTPRDLDFETIYDVDVSIYDPNRKYTSITLYYGYVFEHDMEEEMSYTSIPITSDRQLIELSDIFTSEPFHIYLEGTTTEGTELLDEIWVTPPFELYASIYRDFISSTSIGFHVYNDMVVTEITYDVAIYKGETLIRTELITPISSGFHGSEFHIDDLSPSTTYFFEITAIYVHPQTLREERQIIYEEELTTLDAYSYTYTNNTVGEYYEITITLDDPSNYFVVAFYEVYDTTGEEEVYHISESFIIEGTGSQKSVTFNIFIPSLESYKIRIGIRNDLDVSIHQKIDVIIVE